MTCETLSPSGKVKTGKIGSNGGVEGAEAGTERYAQAEKNAEVLMDAVVSLDDVIDGLKEVE